MRSIGNHLTQPAQPLWARLASLPRDSRDTLFLLAIIALVVAPQFGYLPLWCSALFGGLLLWRGLLAWQARPLPRRAWLWGLLLVSAVATWLTHRTLLGREAGVTLIVLLLSLKTLELRARRDAFVVFFLSFFTMLTNFFNSQSLLTAAAMLVALMGLLTALVNAHMPVGRPPLWQAARIAAAMTLLGAPIMALLFVLFPRFGPLWGLPSDAMTGRSGLSANMKVGEIGRLALDGSIALRLRFDGPVPAPQDLYLRGPVLSYFDGREWRTRRGLFAPRPGRQAQLQVSGAALRYEVTLEPHQRPWLLLLDAAIDKPQLPRGIDAVMSGDLQWLASQPVTELMRYRAESYPNFRHGPLQRSTTLFEELQLPDGFNPRTLAWAAEIRRDPRYARADGLALAAVLLERLRSGGYRYTLEPGLTGRDSADAFWFDQKEGFCEHIASAFVIALRALDVPARIVTGYQGGEANALDGFWVVRQSDAHAWAEVWQAGQGWLRVDPTAVVSPGRIGSLSRLQAPGNALTNAFNDAMRAVSPGLLANLRSAWEAANNRWNQWVLNYSQSRQLDLLKDIGFTSPNWQDLLTLLLELLIVASLGAALWSLWQQRTRDPWLRLLHRLHRRLRRAGLEVGAATPPRRIAALLEQRFGVDAARRDWLLRLEALRYAPGAGAGDWSALQREFASIAWPSRPVLAAPSAAPARSGPAA